MAGWGWGRDQCYEGDGGFWIEEERMMDTGGSWIVSSPKYSTVTK